MRRRAAVRADVQRVVAGDDEAVGDEPPVAPPPEAFEHLTAVGAAGHSTQALGDLTALLAAHGIARLGDVRTVPAAWTQP